MKFPDVSHICNISHIHRRKHWQEPRVSAGSEQAEWGAGEALWGRPWGPHDWSDLGNVLGSRLQAGLGYESADAFPGPNPGPAPLLPPGFTSDSRWTPSRSGPSQLRASPAHPARTHRDRHLHSRAAPMATIPHPRQHRRFSERPPPHTHTPFRSAREAYNLVTRSQVTSKGRLRHKGTKPASNSGFGFKPRAWPGGSLVSVPRQPRFGARSPGHGNTHQTVNEQMGKWNKSVPLSLSLQKSTST